MLHSLSFCIGVLGATPDLLAGAQKVAVYLGRTAPYRTMDELLSDINVLIHLYISSFVNDFVASFAFILNLYFSPIYIYIYICLF